MARKLGPKHKLCRRVGERLCQSKKCPVLRRAYAPGVHGPSGRLPRLTSYGLQLREKQKAKFIYGLLEKQFRNYFEKAVSMQGDSSLNLVRLLESRLDNVVYRLGFGGTRAQARQLVGHRHVTVNGKIVNIPSFVVSPDDVIAVREKSHAMPLFTTAAESEKREVPLWLRRDGKDLKGTVVTIPDESIMQQNFNPKTIVEFYSR